jgi:hypothetical protein
VCKAVSTTLEHLPRCGEEQQPARRGLMLWQRAYHASHWRYASFIRCPVPKSEPLGIPLQFTDCRPRTSSACCCFGHCHPHWLCLWHIGMIQVSHNSKTLCQKRGALRTWLAILMEGLVTSKAMASINHVESSMCTLLAKCGFG